jgi:hypothetical protein
LPCKDAIAWQCLSRPALWRSVTEKLHVEVDQQANVTAGQLEVGKQLRLVNGLQLSYGFELNDDQVFNEQINAVTAVDPYAPINNGEGLLAVDADAAFGQLEDHARLVRGLQQAWTKFSPVGRAS